jgi:hypothetical protein
MSTRIEDLGSQLVEGIKENSEWAVGILTGIKLLFGGFWMVAIGRGVRGAAEESQAEA